MYDFYFKSQDRNYGVRNIYLFLPPKIDQHNLERKSVNKFMLEIFTL